MSAAVKDPDGLGNRKSIFIKKMTTVLFECRSEHAKQPYVDHQLAQGLDCNQANHEHWRIKTMGETQNLRNRQQETLLENLRHVL